MSSDAHVHEEDFETPLNYTKSAGKDSGTCKIDVNLSRHLCTLLWFH